MVRRSEELQEVLQLTKLNQRVKRRRNALMVSEGRRSPKAVWICRQRGRQKSPKREPDGRVVTVRSKPTTICRLRAGRMRVMAGVQHMVIALIAALF